MAVRWMVERKGVTRERDQLQIVEVYAPGENKEIVKKENNKWTYERELIHLNE